VPSPPYITTSSYPASPQLEALLFGRLERAHLGRARLAGAVDQARLAHALVELRQAAAARHQGNLLRRAALDHELDVVALGLHVERVEQRVLKTHRLTRKGDECDLLHRSPFGL